MRKLFVMLAAAALSVVVAIPAFAQDRPDIPTLLTNDGSFTTLLAALDAANLADTLGGDGPFTVFAPTDDAFAATLGSLNMSAADVLANPDLLTQVLGYHVVPGRNFFRNLIGGAQLDTVEGSTLNLYRNSAGQLMVNGVVISTVDQIASNGVVFYIDGVLLPPDALPTAHVRVAHFSPDAPAVDVFVNGAVGAAGVETNTISDFVDVPAGTTEFVVSAAGTDYEEGVIGPVTLFLAPGSYTTVSAIGSLESGSLTATVVPDDFATVGSQAQITFFHGIEGAPAVDILANGSPIVTNLAFPGTITNADGSSNDGAYTLNVAPGTYNVSVVATGTTGPALLTADGFEVVAGSSYLVGAVGTADSPQLSVSSFDVAGMMAMMDMAPEATPGS